MVSGSTMIQMPFELWSKYINYPLKDKQVPSTLMFLNILKLKSGHLIVHNILT